MQLVIVNKDKCMPGKCENGKCIATFSCTWKVLEQESPYEQPIINLRKCLGCARCTFTCPLGALEVIQRR
ncbi:MAG: 4Fe-4S binding protein [Bacillota bacterium]